MTVLKAAMLVLVGISFSSIVLKKPNLAIWLILYAIFIYLLYIASLLEKLI